MKKKLFILAVTATMALTACTDSQKQQASLLEQQRDSLNQIIAQKDSEIEDMLGTMNDIEEGFREINEAQGRVSVAQRGEGASSAARIRENMEFIQTTMNENRELIAKLKQRLRESTTAGEQLKRTIENLTNQLEQKDKELTELKKQLAAKDIHIAELDKTVSSLANDVNSLRQDNMEKNETITSQDKQLNTAYFVYGTKKELKEHNILKGGEVLKSQFDKNYFTKIDIRVDKDIKVYSRDAKILTTHPAGSYTFPRDANKQYVLHITNPEQFWSTSKYLVIQVK